jgi:pSer/pThr/pTyr-binding forkhead associated (FHA) protein
MRRILVRHRTGTKSGQVEVYPVSRYNSLSLGRDAGCDVRFHPTKDIVVSRNHALIEWSQDDPPLFRISDLLSSNGTFLNGRRIGSSVLLRSGDKVQLGTEGPIVEFTWEDVMNVGGASDEAVHQAVRTDEIPIPTITHVPFRD